MIAAVIFQRLKWARTTWLSLLAPILLMAGIALMGLLAATTALDGA